MRVPLRLRSRDEQRAVFSKMSYSEFNKKANKDFVKLVSDRVHEDSFHQWNKNMDKEFAKGYSTKAKDILLTDSTMKMHHTYYGGDVPYDKFWFETDGGKVVGNRFSLRSVSYDGELIGYVDVPEPEEERISPGAGLFSEVSDHAKRLEWKEYQTWLIDELGSGRITRDRFEQMEKEGRKNILGAK